MGDLKAELDAARALEVDELADAIQAIGFSCTRCGACCQGRVEEDPGELVEEHTATVFPDEVRDVVDGQARRDDGDPYDWRDVARPMPFGLAADEDGQLSGGTFEWALQTDECGDCAFYDDGTANDPGACTIYDDRPFICRTYPFSVALATSEPMGEVVDRVGPVRAHECEGLGRDIERQEAEALARTLKERAIREVEEMMGVRDNYEPVDVGPGEVVVHDSEGTKRPDGSAYR